MTHPVPDILHTILDVGACMAEALGVGDVDGFAALLEERGRLLEHLRAVERPARPDAAWEAVAAALAAQHHTLTQTLADQEARMAEALGSMERFKGASQSYTQRHAAGRLLQGGLEG